jgi:hypothetical protein
MDDAKNCSLMALDIILDGQNLIRTPLSYWQSVKTEIELIALRSRITEGRVFWILPAIKPERQKIVVKVANSYNDRVIRIPEVSTDGVHPTYNGYKRLGEMTK